MISVVIPVYNVEEYLRTCVESVLQLKTDFEVVLVDDGSTDNSGILCDELAENDSRIKVVHQLNGGLSSARNTGIKHANGEFLLFLDSDDFLDSEETDKMLLEMVPETDVLLGLYRKYYTSEKKYENENCAALLQITGNVPIGKFLNTIPKDGRSCYMTAWRFVVRRQFVLNNGLFFLPGIYHEDEEWTLRLLCKIDHICVSHHYFYQYRQARSGAITGSVKIKNIKDRFIILKRAKELLSDNNIHEDKKKYLKNRMAQLYLSNMIDCRILNKEEKKEIVKQLEVYRSICSEHMSGKIGRMAMICDKLFGVSTTCTILKVLRSVFK